MYHINTIIWLVFGLIGAFAMHHMEYTYFALTISMIWHVAGCIVKDIKKNA